jgi:hypothetical protein
VRKITVKLAVYLPITGVDTFQGDFQGREDAMSMDERKHCLKLG